MRAEMELLGGCGKHLVVQRTNEMLPPLFAAAAAASVFFYSTFTFSSMSMLESCCGLWSAFKYHLRMVVGETPRARVRVRGFEQLASAHRKLRC